jgi:divalent metal cation (Fe/Co/Zn/Cd) transporter
MTAVGSIVGVSGIGLGLWWLDSVAALFIAGSILWDGLRNLRAAVTDLMDERATTYDNKKPHPVAQQIVDHLRGVGWVADAGIRMRDEGHVFHVEAFVVPRDGEVPTLDMLEATRQSCIDLDWKVQDIVLVLTRELPDIAS